MPPHPPRRRCRRPLPRRSPLALALACALLAPSAAWAGAGGSVQLIGRSVQGRPITVIERGAPGGRAVLVVGVIDGNEPAGIAIATSSSGSPPAGVDLWIRAAAQPRWARGRDARQRPRGRHQPELPLRLAFTRRQRHLRLGAARTLGAREPRRRPADPQDPSPPLDLVSPASDGGRRLAGVPRRSSAASPPWSASPRWRSPTTRAASLPGRTTPCPERPRSSSSSPLGR